jgi:hypothetical protein
MTFPWEKKEPQDALEIPECLRRDANNVAPFMRESEVELFYNAFASPATNPPRTAQGWVPPWGSKS